MRLQKFSTLFGYAYYSNKKQKVMFQNMEKMDVKRHKIASSAYWCGL